MIFSGDKYVLSCIKNALLREFPPRWNELRQVLRILMIILKGNMRRKINELKVGINIPKTVTLSVTWKCNLSCRGCYAVNYSNENQLSTREIQRIIKEAVHLGSYYFVIAGGEPLMVPNLIPILAAHRKALFLVITNGTLINKKTVLQLKKTWNILPVISLDGDQDQIDYRRGKGIWQRLHSSMDLLRAHCIFFGISIMLTHLNIRRVLSVEWMNSKWENGARFGFILDYLPFEKSQDKSLNLKAEDFIFKGKQLSRLGIESPLKLFIFPEGEYCKSGCFFLEDQLIHINASGMVEPCPFCQVATENIRAKPLVEILQSNFFSVLHREFSAERYPNTPCILYDHVEKIMSISAEIQTSEPEIISYK